MQRADSGYQLPGGSLSCATNRSLSVAVTGQTSGPSAAMHDEALIAGPAMLARLLSLPHA